VGESLEIKIRWGTRKAEEEKTRRLTEKLGCMKSVKQIYDVNIGILLQPHDITLCSMEDLRKA
jgi:hypothetical protein